MKPLTWVLVALLLILLGLALMPGRVVSYNAPQTQNLTLYEVLRAEVSGYSSDFEQTDSAPFTTASGLIVSEGTIACPERFEFGTRVKIEGKEYRCEDRMAERYREGNFFDIWFHGKQEAHDFGRQTVSVIVLD